MALERFAFLMPSSVRQWVSKELVYASMKQNPQKFAGMLALESLAAGVLAAGVSVWLFHLGTLYSAAAFVLGFLLIFGGVLAWVNNAADARGKRAEKSLPDALQLISSNIKAGLTTEQSLFVSARPEFGALSKELRDTSKRVMVGERLEHAVLFIPRHIKSRVLERTMWLISEGITNGGQIANLLIQLSVDLREENSLKSEISANVSMYVMLIFFSAAFGAPMLFGISSFIVGVLSEQSGSVGISPEQIQSFAAKSPALGLIGIPTSAISPDFIVFFATVAVIVTSVFASLVLGVISSGNEKAGLKYLPAIFIISLLVFFVTRTIVAGAFGGFLR